MYLHHNSHINGETCFIAAPPVNTRIMFQLNIRLRELTWAKLSWVCIKSCYSAIPQGSSCLFPSARDSENSISSSIGHSWNGGGERKENLNVFPWTVLTASPTATRKLPPASVTCPRTLIRKAAIQRCPYTFQPAFKQTVRNSCKPADINQNSDRK